jgi:hypothetical protein
MRRVIVAFAFLAVQSLQGQARSFVAPSAGQFKECLYTFLLNGIPLTKERRQEARKLIEFFIDSGYAIQRALPPSKKSADMQYALIDTIYADLRVYATTTDDSLRYEKNVNHWIKSWRAGECHGEPPHG